MNTAAKQPPKVPIPRHGEPTNLECLNEGVHDTAADRQGRLSAVDAASEACALGQEGQACQVLMVRDQNGIHSFHVNQRVEQGSVEGGLAGKRRVRQEQESK